MMAYGQIYRCPELMLLYPHHAGLGEGTFARGYAVAGCEDRLRLSTIDLRKEEGAIVRALAGLARGPLVAA